MVEDLYIYDGKMTRLNIDVYGTKRTLNERFLSNIHEKLEYFSLNREGNRTVFSVRRKLYEMEPFERPGNR
ncbi:MAG: hypothetical protein ACP5GR_04920 [Thermoplasmata archaeon]